MSVHVNPARGTFSQVYTSFPGRSVNIRQAAQIITGQAISRYVRNPVFPV